MAKVGRKPAKLDANQVAHLAGLGLTIEQISAALGISDTTFYKNKKLKPKIAEAWKRGKARRIAKVADSLLKRAEESSDTAAIFYLKAQAGWRDKQIIEHEGNSDAAPIRITLIGRDPEDE